MRKERRKLTPPALPERGPDVAEAIDSFETTQEFSTISSGKRLSCLSSLRLLLDPNHVDLLVEKRGDSISRTLRLAHSPMSQWQISKSGHVLETQQMIGAQLCPDALDLIIELLKRGCLRYAKICCRLTSKIQPIAATSHSDYVTGAGGGLPEPAS